MFFNVEKKNPVILAKRVTKCYNGIVKMEETSRGRICKTHKVDWKGKF